jgi:hypothetical protein
VLVAQGFHFFFSLGADLLLLDVHLLDLGLLGGFDFLLEAVQLLTDDILDVGDMLGGDGLTGLDNDRVRGIEVHINGSGLTELLLQRFFQALAFVHDGLEALGDFFLGGGFHGVALFLQRLQFGVAVALHGKDLVVDFAGAFALGTVDVILELAQSALAGFFINIGDDILSKIENTVQIAAGDIQQQTKIGRNTAGIPNMRDRSSQFNMAETFTADGRLRDLHAAFFADDALVSRILVLTAIALPVTGRTENRLTEEAVFFRTQAAVVNGFRLKYFTVRPASNRLR